VKNFDDLKGKRVNIGNPGSGQRATMDVVLDAKGWTTDDFALASELKAAEQAGALGDNKIDAMIYTVGHPAGAIQEADHHRRQAGRSTANAIDKLVDDNPTTPRRRFPAACTRAMTTDTNTFGVKATFVSSADVPEEVIYRWSRRCSTISTASRSCTLPSRT
jgi:TRAP transporter TAXI family solute receptor